MFISCFNGFFYGNVVFVWWNLIWELFYVKGKGNMRNNIFELCLKEEIEFFFKYFILLISLMGFVNMYSIY